MPDAAPTRARLRDALTQASAIGALLVVAAGALGFLLLVELAEGKPHGADVAVLEALRQPGAPDRPVGPAWLLITMRDLTALGGFPVLTLMGLVALGSLLLRQRWEAAALLVLALPGGLALNLALKEGFVRPRPDLVAHLVETASASFPSGHAMLSATAYLTLGAVLAGGAVRRRDRAYIMGTAVLLTLLVGGSRVYLGVHWPSDVLAGWCLGAAWAMACWLLLRLVWRPRLRPGERVGATVGEVLEDRAAGG